MKNWIFFGDTIKGLKLSEKFKILPLCHDLIYPKTIILYYIEDIHFKLVGYFTNYMKTVFDTNDIPEPLLKIFKTDCKK